MYILWCVSTIAYSTPATESTATLTSAITVTISSSTTPSISTTTPSKDWSHVIRIFILFRYDVVTKLDYSWLPGSPTLRDSEEDIIAQASCSGLNVAHGYIFAVRRTCSNDYDDCNAVCENSSLKSQDPQMSEKT